MNAEMFRSAVEEITQTGRDSGIEEASLTDAWNEAYTSMNVIGAYHLYEDGFHVGDADKESIIIDAEDRKIIIRDLEEPDELLDALDNEFIDIYDEFVKDAISEEKLSVLDARD